MKELLYIKIYTDIKEKISKEELSPGSRLKGVRELAKEWNTSANTVLKALDILTKEGFIAKKHGSSIFIEKQESWEKALSEIVDIEMFFYDLEIPFNQALISSIERVANQLNYNLLIKSFVSLDDIVISNKKPAIVVPNKLSNIPDSFSARKMPTIFVGEFNPPVDFGYSFAVANVYEGFFYLAEQLVKSGRRKISYIGIDPIFENDAGWSAFYDVCAGMHNGACREYSIGATSCTIEQGMNAMEKLLLTENYPDAVICRNNVLAAGAMSVCKKAGLKIPDDICFVAAGKDMLAPILEPPLSGLIMPTDAIGFSAINYIDSILKERVSPDFIYKAKFSLEMIQRESYTYKEVQDSDDLYWV